MGVSHFALVALTTLGVFPTVTVGRPRWKKSRLPFAWRARDLKTEIERLRAEDQVTAWPRLAAEVISEAALATLQTFTIADVA